MMQCFIPRCLCLLFLTISFVAKAGEDAPQHANLQPHTQTSILDRQALAAVLKLVENAVEQVGGLTPPDDDEDITDDGEGLAHPITLMVLKDITPPDDDEDITDDGEGLSDPTTLVALTEITPPDDDEDITDDGEGLTATASKILVVLVVLPPASEDF